MASSSTSYRLLKAARSRQGQAIAASVLTTVTASLWLRDPIRNDAAALPEQLSTQVKRQQVALQKAANPYTPLAWGTNKNLTLQSDATVANQKSPKPLLQVGNTPLRDLVLAETYGAAVDAKGDCWMWGKGFDAASGGAGRSLKGKKVKSLAPTNAKLYALSQDGKIYVLSASKQLQAQRHNSPPSWWNYFFGTDALVDYAELKADVPLQSGERFSGFAAGKNHLLAVTTKGRTFSVPVNPSGNAARQLGTRAELPTTSTSSLSPEVDPRYSTTLSLIPALGAIEIEQVAAGEATSFVRTRREGRVLGFGANQYGQIGLGNMTSVDIIPTPCEVVLAKAYPGGTSVQCTNIAAGANNTFFTVERSFPTTPGQTHVDLLACGSGLTGALGNGLWSSAMGSPVKVKTVSGLQEYSEKANAFLPIGIHQISVSLSPNSHIFAVLDTVALADDKGVKEGRYGKDVMVWGANADYQLGNGKRSNLSVPQHLPPMSPKAIEALSTLPQPTASESAMSSGTPSPMPHSRLQLHSGTADAYDLEGKLIKRKVRVEETMVAGYNASVLYHKIVE